MRPNVIAISMLLLGMDSTLLAPSRADTLTVCPDGTGDYTLIQDAIDAAVDGDVVQLCDGEFATPHGELVDLRGKAITLRSASGDPTACRVLDALLCATGEGSTTVVRGITVSRPPTDAPGALWCEHASPTFEDVRVEGSVTGAFGGVYLYRSDAVFRRCAIVGNAAWRQDVGDGGGVVVGSGSPAFEECVIAGNRAMLNWGGVLCSGVGAPTFVRCSIVGNSAGGEGGGLVVTAGTHVTLDHCVLWGNCAGASGDEAVVQSGGILTLICCDVDSTGFAGSGTINYVGENLFVDPLFCAPASCDAAPTTAGDYRLAQNSPCLLGPCGQIGAFGQGCGIIGIDPWSWGRIKALHR